MIRDKNEHRMQITFDMNDPIQAKAVEIISTDYKRSIKSFLSECIMVRVMMPLSISDWMLMQRDFPLLSSARTAEPADVHINTPKQTVVEEKAISTEDSSKNVQDNNEDAAEFEFTIDPDESEGLKNDELDELAESMKSFGLEI